MKAAKTLIVIAGPTAVGKTALSIAVAQHFKTAIISADSRQCYQEMTIGTAKPSPEELLAVPHYFINSHSIEEALNAGTYEREALAYCEAIFSLQDVAVLCGGTGLYIKALCEGIDEMPAVDKAIEQQIQKSYEEQGLAWLQEAIAAKDPAFFAQAEQQNHSRLIRALAFMETNGVSIMNYRSGVVKKRPFKIIKIALDLPRETLYERIDRRVDIMMEQGLMAEITALYPYRELKNLQTVGYKEFYEMGEWPLSEARIADALVKVKQHSRNYAKRQLTWFRKDPEFKWFRPDDLIAILDYIQQEQQQ
ncbi:tRNA (adenosine(37)-N6)-dimethylallyltransferase MiaA [Taibaiella sp. KBW10]|uniref:tRNA (adenosine(37)-N6)-dimethylallyltransferase MiaA n=1 Tax=Taibaiella sp. KBW10 TaxID=2153357 RepID=UPI000F5A5598|nr:tRNA (adenosine(37)-N6)-dimethylallyltransferase MiaA [Taibaiella sp. KBW10]RQO30661.1 tRNA (adenosine(37)-N6)-dimethylallyltransferase MiaA [Taibaiella sp. KBW10]